MPACNTCWLLFSKMKNPGKACAVLSLGSGLPDPALRASSHHLFSFLDSLRDVDDQVGKLFVPSFDQSEAEGLDSIIRTMLETQTRFLSKWESDFLISVYGNRLSFKQRKTVFSIKKKIEEREAAERGSIDSTNKTGQGLSQDE